MGTIYTSCPNTGREISTGIDTDADSFARLPDVIALLLCPHCGERHNWSKHSAYLRDGGRKNGPSESCGEG